MEPWGVCVNKKDFKEPEEKDQGKVMITDVKLQYWSMKPSKTFKR